MGTKVINFEKVFNSLCHFMAISKTVDTNAVLDNLVLAAVVFHDANYPIDSMVVAEAVDVYFSIELTQTSIRASLDRLCSSERLHQTNDSKYYAPKKVADQVSRKAAEAEQLENSVRDEWFEGLSNNESLNSWFARVDQKQLWLALRAYMAKSFRRHGVQTIQLLDASIDIPVDGNLKLSALLDQALDETGFETNEQKQFARIAIRQFFQFQTNSRIEYLSQLLDGTFSFFAINFDEAISEYLSSEIKPLSIFLDTNFIFGMLELHNNPLVDVSHELISTISKDFPNFKLYYHTATLEEMQRTLSAIGEGLQARQWKQSLSRAAVNNGQLAGLALKYHEANSQSLIDPEIFLSKYLHPTALLDDKGFEIYEDLQPADTNTKGELVAEYKAFIESRRFPKPYRVYDHDMQVLLTVRSKRGLSTRSVLDSGVMFLTCDYYLYAFDQQEVRETGQIGTVILPNHLLQMLRPLVPSSPDFDRRFVETFAIPEFRTVGSDYSRTVSKVLMYLATFDDIGEETATRILANEFLIGELKGVEEDSDEFAESIESALAQDNELLLEEVELWKDQAEEASEEKRVQAALVAQKDSEIGQLSSEVAEKEKLAAVSADRVNELTKSISVLDSKFEEREESLRIQEVETQNQLDSLAEASRKAQKSSLMWRIAFALFFCIVLTWLFFTELVHLSWLSQHEHRLGLIVVALLVIWGLGGAIVFEKYRKWILTAVVVGAIVEVIQIL